MAAAREEENPYNGLGAGGKFRNKPYRRGQSTPYDRPPTAIRNPSIVGGGGDGGAYNGWLRKIVDPAQKLVISTAHRLFSSVFTKRLTHTPPLTPPPPDSSEKQEARDKQSEAFSTDILEEQKSAMKRGQNAEDGCVKDLEKILKQKSFTRSEVDHLMVLLRERDIDKLVEEEQKASKPVSFHEQREELTNTMVPYHDTESFRVSNKPTNSSKCHQVFIEDVGSPTELARAYMGSRSLTVSPLVLGLRNQASAEDSTALTSLTHLSKLPVLSFVSKSLAHVGSRENGYVTPRPRGRSALYSMARSPYSRGHLTVTPKSSRPIADCLDGSSPQPWDGSGSSVFKGLKRSSSVFENDIGSAASLRRLRQKPNLSYQRNCLIPVSASGVTSNSDYQPSTSVRKMHTLSGQNHTFTKETVRTNSKILPGSSKSSEMASRILQQLDTIVSPPKERPSVIKLGQALKSLGHIDSSIFLEFSNNQDGSVGTSQQNSRNVTSEKKGNDQNDLPNTLVGLDKLSPSVNSLARAAVQKDSIPNQRSSANNLLNSLVNPPMQNKQSFKLSAHEDYVDMEDVSYCNEPSYCNGQVAPNLDGKAKQNTFVPDHTLRADQSTSVDKPSSIFYGSVNELAGKDVNAGQVVSDKRLEFSFSNAIASSSLASSVMTQSTLAVDKSFLSKEFKSALPVISFSDKGSSLKDQDALTSPLRFVANNGTVASNANEAETKHKQSASSLDSKPQNLTSFASAGDSPFLFGTNAQDEDRTASNGGVVKGTSVPAISTSSASFSFGIDPAVNSSNGSVVSSPVTFGSTSQKPRSSSDVSVAYGGSGMNAVPPTNTFAAALSATSNASQCTPPAPAFKFGLPTTSPASAVPFTFSALPSTAFSTNMDGSSVVAPAFGLNAATATTSSAQEFVSTGAANGPSAQVSKSLANETRISALSQSIPVQPAASSSASSNSASASPSVANLFPSASSFGSNSAATSVASTSSLLGTVPGLGGSPFKAPPAGGFSFGGSTSTATNGSSTSSTSAPTTFGSTNTTLSAAASTGIFQFGSTGSSSFSPTVAATTFRRMTGPAAGTSPFGLVPTSTSTVVPIFGLNGTTSSASTGALAFGSIATSSTSTAPSTVFGFTSAFTFPFTSGAPQASSTTFGCGATAAPGTSSSAPAFQFGVATTPASNISPQPSFPNSNSKSGFGFGSSAPATNGSNSNDQMNMDTMAQDSVQQASPALAPSPVFGQQQLIAPLPVGFAFGTGGGANPNPFQFGTPTQQQQTIQNPSPFQTSGSLDFNAGGGGSFSLGTGGGDKSARRMVKVRKSSQRRK